MINGITASIFSFFIFIPMPLNALTTLLYINSILIFSLPLHHIKLLQRCHVVVDVAVMVVVVKYILKGGRFSHAFLSGTFGLNTNLIISPSSIQPFHPLIPPPHSTPSFHSIIPPLIPPSPFILNLSLQPLIPLPHSTLVPPIFHPLTPTPPLPIPPSPFAYNLLLRTFHCPSPLTSHPTPYSHPQPSSTTATFR